MKLEKFYKIPTIDGNDTEIKITILDYLDIDLLKNYPTKFENIEEYLYVFVGLDEDISWLELNPSNNPYILVIKYNIIEKKEEIFEKIVDKMIEDQIETIKYVIELKQKGDF